MWAWRLQACVWDCLPKRSSQVAEASGPHRSCLSTTAEPWSRGQARVWTLSCLLVPMGPHVVKPGSYTS